MIWETLGWGQWYTTKQGMRDTRPDYRVSPEVRCSWDEATCTQLVYLYNEITEKFQGDARHFFALMGRKRGADAPSLRIANVDIGGGTIDLSITTFAVTGDEATAARILSLIHIFPKSAGTASRSFRLWKWAPCS